MFGEYILLAANKDVDRWNQRGLGLACITVALLIHGTNVKYGLWLQNFIGIIKLLIVLLIVVAGWVCVVISDRVVEPTFAARSSTDIYFQAALGGALKIEKPGNFDNAFAGTANASAYGIVTAIFVSVWPSYCAPHLSRLKLTLAPVECHLEFHVGSNILLKLLHSRI